MNPRKRNELRRFVAGTLEKFTLGAVGFGVLLPLFDPSVEGAFASFVGGIVFGVLIYAIAFYILRTVEDEE